GQYQSLIELNGLFENGGRKKHDANHDKPELRVDRRFEVEVRMLPLFDNAHQQCRKNEHAYAGTRLDDFHEVSVGHIARQKPLEVTDTSHPVGYCQPDDHREYSKYDCPGENKGQ